MIVNLTKNRMADAFRQLMDKKSFSSISVSDICDACSMHRKSFYYHFKDKYDLVAWIYDNDTACGDDTPADMEGVVSRLEWLLQYFYENREYYSKLLRIEGQNSFSDHFSRQVNLSIEKILSEMFPKEEIERYQVNFISQGVSSVVLNWIKEKEEDTPEQVMEKVINCYRLIARVSEKI